VSAPESPIRGPPVQSPYEAVQAQSVEEPPDGIHLVHDVLLHSSLTGVRDERVGGQERQGLRSRGWSLEHPPQDVQPDSGQPLGHHPLTPVRNGDGLQHGRPE
jgi:hypothetical protein